MAMARVRTVFTGVAGTPWYSNLYWADDGAESGAEGYVEAVGAFWVALQGAISDNVSWIVQSEVAIIDEATGNLTGIETVPSTGSTGTASDEELPFQTQALVRLNTGEFVHNRRVRGRIFIPAMGESNNVGGLPSSGLRASLDAAAETLRTSNGGVMCVWSRPFAGKEGNPARTGTKHFVTSAEVSTQWAVLRSRRD
jgi:hypothetical protein